MFADTKVQSISDGEVEDLSGGSSRAGASTQIYVAHEHCMTCFTHQHEGHPKHSQDDVMAAGAFRCTEARLD